MTPWETRLPHETSPEQTALVHRLLPLLVQGDHPALVALREQLRHVRISRFELSEVGFFAYLAVSDDDPKADPPDLAGGSALIEVEGMQTFRNVIRTICRPRGGRC